MVNIILEHNGTIIEILGDGILVIFGAPIQRENDAESAVVCALSMQLAITETNARHPEEGLPEVDMGIGIHTGDVVVGNIGSQKRTKYGVVGSPVNLTGRIESYTVGGQVLISESTYQETAASVQIRNTMEVEPKGVNRPITLYEVVGIRGASHLALSAHQESLRRLDTEIPIRYTVLEEKFVNRSLLEGRFVELSRQEALLHAETPIPSLSDLKIQLFSPGGGMVSDELFAKVLRVSATDPTQVVIRFTSIPDSIIPLFQGGAVSALS
jgi:adenylate cyclase